MFLKGHMSNIELNVILFQRDWHTLLAESDHTTSCCDNSFYKPSTVRSQVDLMWPAHSSYEC